MNFFEKNKYWFLVGGLVLIIILLLFKIVNNTNETEPISILTNDIGSTNNNEVNDTVFVDIKGAVKKPGVYELDSDAKVIDAISKAGGLTKKADTKNINLSAHVKDEMVIYIFSKNELKSTTITSSVPYTTNVINYDNCISTTSSVEKDTTSTTSNLVNINTASKDELMTLSGIGSSKADQIILKRMENRFTKIEDIMTVSGIGESAFAKIKDNITV